MDIPLKGLVPTQHIPCNTKTTTASCTLCGFTGSSKEIADHNCLLNPDDIPNRFDPFEALDTIVERIEDLEEQLHEEIGLVACIGRLADIRGEVRALRAYITGMER